MTKSESRDFSVTDYFDDIKPSLLNSDDIHRYASEGWLVTEYEEKRLLSAGYKLRFLGRLVQWKLNSDGEMERLEEDVTEDKPVKLYGNSIAYLHMREEFRMPLYIAARFNLRIRHVHQGLLLGTGPIVDPGFSGSLLVPLHNLTGNTYSFMGGDNFIHVEFTKLSPLRRWNKSVDPNSSHDDHYVTFPTEKITSSPDFYFNKSMVLEKGGVVSNLAPLAFKVDAALLDIETFKEDVKSTLRRNNFIGFGGIIALVALIITAGMMVLQANSIYTGVRDSAADVEAKLVEARSLLTGSSLDPSGQEDKVVGGQRDSESGDDVSEGPINVSEFETREIESDDRLEQEEVIEDELALPENEESEKDPEEDTDSAAEL